LVNSVSGIFGQLSKLSSDINYFRILSLCFAVFTTGRSVPECP
jgi:hypothetical protein